MVRFNIAKVTYIPRVYQLNLFMKGLIARMKSSRISITFFISDSAIDGFRYEEDDMLRNSWHFIILRRKKYIFCYVLCSKHVMGILIFPVFLT